MSDTKKDKKNKFNFVELSEFEKEEKLEKNDKEEVNNKKKEEEKDISTKDQVKEKPKEDTVKVEKEEDKKVDIEEEKKEETVKNQQPKKEKSSKEENIKEEKKKQSKKPNKEKDIDFDKVSETTDNKPKEELKNSLPRKMHISFEVRVAIIIIFIIIFFTTACFLVLEAINFGKKEKINYSENATASYSVCLNEVYNNVCMPEGQLYYSSGISSVKANLKYNVDFSANIDYKLSYYVIAQIRITDENNNLIYNADETLVEKTDISQNSNNINIDENVLFNYEKYNEGARLYTRNNPLATAVVTIKLYLVEPEEERQLSSIEIPFQKEGFNIKAEGTSNSDYVEVNNNEWNTYNSICAGIASVLIILSLALVYKVTRLILKVTSNHSEYEWYLGELLREYDRLIVVARDGYESRETKDVVKVDSFDELLDARDTLEKPIIYSKINNIKSEFIVEDEDKIFKYTLKESDVIEEE